MSDTDSYDEIVTFGHVLLECGQVTSCDELLTLIVHGAGKRNVTGSMN